VKRVITLVEMVVVVAIITIICALGVVSFSSVTSRRLQRDISLLRADLGWTREMAIAKNKNFCVLFPDAHTYRIFEENCGTGNLVKEVQLESSIVNPSPSFDVTFYTFDDTHPIPDGVIHSESSVNGELVITLQQKSITGNLHIFEETGFIDVE